jgi:diaminohydroxyphosphoribosylaminopyrimidine deaminase/5-amino-6-(5-phosphoribosylamino)uracil reductase
MVGAGTVRIDDPHLTVRPLHDRSRPFVRVVACETDTISEMSRIFLQEQGYVPTIVLAPAGSRERFLNLRNVAEIIFIGGQDDRQLDLQKSLRALHQRGVYSVLCEGGPTLAGRLIAAGLVERVYWAIAPLFLQNERAVPVLAGADLAAAGRKVRFDRIEHVGPDVVISGRMDV